MGNYRVAEAELIIANWRITMHEYSTIGPTSASLVLHPLPHTLKVFMVYHIHLFYPLKQDNASSSWSAGLCFRPVRVCHERKSTYVQCKAVFWQVYHVQIQYKIINLTQFSPHSYLKIFALHGAPGPAFVSARHGPWTGAAAILNNICHRALGFSA